MENSISRDTFRINMSIWIYPEYSRTQVRRAGDILRESNDPFSQVESIDILNNWKAAHELPLDKIMGDVIEYTEQFDFVKTISQRRKRTESILLKLKLQPKLDLARMQDLVGFRIVFRHDEHKKNREAIEKLLTELAYIEKGLKVKRKRNYIDEPRQSGYRSVHVIFQLDSPEYEEHKTMQVELQIRTRMQHIWATAVETVGMFDESNLKQGLGDQQWLRFFRIMSDIMAMDEGTMAFDKVRKSKLCEELQTITKENNVVQQLNVIQAQHTALRRAVHDLEKASRVDATQLTPDYFLVKLDLIPFFEDKDNEPTIEVQTFSNDEHIEATEKYGEWEEDTHAHPLCFVLLAKSKNFEAFQQGFPNYFADIREFMNLHNQYVS